MSGRMLFCSSVVTLRSYELVNKIRTFCSLTVLAFLTQTDTISLRVVDRANKGDG
jgi:hypothetical protein